MKKRSSKSEYTKSLFLINKSGNKGFSFHERELIKEEIALLKKQKAKILRDLNEKISSTDKLDFVW